MKALGCLLALLLGFFLMVIALSFSILRRMRELFFGTAAPDSRSSSASSSARTSSSDRASSKKVFADNEGEYVDFEEIK